jgi:NADPH:quinone reductase-like Zn-dependent oxidoreductase
MIGSRGVHMKRRYKLLLGIAGLLGAGVVAFAMFLSHDKPCPAPVVAAEGERTMLAVRAHCYGGVDALTLERVPVPTPAADQLLVRVHAAGINPLDWHYLHGQPYIMRMMSGFGRPEHPQVGVDYAGIVEAVGESVSNFRSGDAVVGSHSGAFAEYLVVPEGGSVVHMPDGGDFEQAAAVPVAGSTALQAVRDAGRVGPGTRVLINGASGGVGTFAVQIARALGAEVTGVSSARNTELVRGLGADHTIDYTQEDFTRGERRYDVIVDNVGNHTPSAMRRALAPDGLLVMVTGPKSNRWLGPITRMLGVRLSAPFVRQTQLTLFTEMGAEDLATLTGMMHAGTVRAVIDRRFALAEVPDAIAYLEQGRTRGKNVIHVIER